MDRGVQYELFTFAFSRAASVHEACPRRLRSCGTLLALIYVQLIFAYALWDNSKLFAVLGRRASLAPTLSHSFFYWDLLLGNGTPVIHVMVSTTAFVLLALCARQDAQALLLSGCPLEHLLLPDAMAQGHADHERTGASRAATPLALHAGRLAGHTIGIYLQVIWTFRATLVPSLTLLASALICASTTNAAELVLNSVAAAFILELDDVTTRRRVEPIRRPETAWRVRGLCLWARW